MAATQGLVHRLKLVPGPFLAWVYIGPTATDTTLLLVVQDEPTDAVDVAFRASMADALSAALATRQEVTAIHGDNNATITQLDFEAP
jgi:hypothetical protein